MTAYVYYAHLAQPLGDPSRPRMSARHYSGKATGQHWSEREQEHRSGKGAKLLAAANRAGIAWHISTVYECADAETAAKLETLLKLRGHHEQNCAACQALARGEEPSAEPVIVAVASIDAFAPNSPVDQLIARHIARLIVKRERDAARKAAYLAEQAEEARWAEALGHDQPDIHRPYVGQALAASAWTPETAYPLDPVGPEFDLAAYRRELAAAVAPAA